MPLSEILKSLQLNQSPSHTKSPLMEKSTAVESSAHMLVLYGTGLRFQWNHIYSISIIRTID